MIMQLERVAGNILYAGKIFEMYFNILGIEKHTNDHSSVHAWVTEMRSQEYNPVLFFKHQGTEDQENVLQKDDFLLCISI